jgi:hypothetical protein
MVANAAKSIAIKWLKRNLFDRLPPQALTDYPTFKTTLDYLEQLEGTPVTVSFYLLRSAIYL